MSETGAGLSEGLRSLVAQWRRDSGGNVSAEADEVDELLTRWGIDNRIATGHS